MPTTRRRKIAREAANAAVSRKLAKALRTLFSPNGAVREPGALGLGRGLPPQMHELTVIQELHPDEQIPEGLVNHGVLGLGAGRRPRGLLTLIGGSRKRRRARKA
jgi:hypothetical protein